MADLATALVTGASRGIGEQVARLLAAAGHPVVVNYAVDKDLAESVVAEISRNGGRAIAVCGNVSDSNEVRGMFEAAEDEFGPVNVLVANAGVTMPRFTPLQEVDDDTFDHMFDVNTRGTFYLLREAARRFTAGGRIITLSSSSVAMAVAGLAVHSGSKAAVEAFTTTLARDLRGRDITVNCVAPGPIATDHFFQGKSDQVVHQWEQMSPLERIGRPEEAAALIAFLASPAASWVNGQVIRINGGVI